MATRRRDINSLSDAELTDYIHAVNVLRERSAGNPDDPTGFEFQAALHNDHFVGPCEHGNDLFLAWHRAHLRYFEQLLQAADPPRTSSVTIPYWDWIHAEEGRKFPAAFDEPGLFEDGRNPDLKIPLPPDTLSIVTEEKSWPEFGGYPEGDPLGDYGRLERGPHNYMHGTFIGGKMENPGTAAEDPLYFSFHCFIDLLWAEWQRRNGMPPPTSPDEPLRGFLSQPRHQVRDFTDPEALGYEYDYSDELTAAFDVPAPPPRPRLLLAAEPMPPIFAQRAVTLLREAKRVQYSVPAVSAGAATVVRVQVSVPRTGSYTLFAYLHPEDVPFARDDPPFAERYFIGYAAVWRSHEMPDADRGHDPHAPHAHHPSSLTARFDMTAALSSAAGPSGRVLTLAWAPAPDIEGAAAELIDEVAVERVETEVYG